MREVKNFRTVYADEGKRLLINGSLHDKVILAQNSKLRIQEINVPSFIGNASTLEEIKEVMINLTKTNLTLYLENNPILSTAKHSEGRYYNVTMEKQNLLLTNIATYQMALQAGVETPLTWNDTGKECEVWTFEELFQLSMEIRSYVAPIISLQQHLETNIKNCTSITEALKMEVDFTKENIENYYPIYLNKLGGVNNEQK